MELGIDFSKIRMARITGGGYPVEADTIEAVKAFLPGNYSVVKLADGLYIVGSDKAGWTLDDYVIPRLVSGLIFVEEVTAEGRHVR